MAQTFHELVGVTGTVVTKLDGTARGGGAKRCFRYWGLLVFVEREREYKILRSLTDRFISRLLGMGDIKG